MFRNRYSLIVLCFFILNSCGVEPKLVFEEINFTTEDITLVEIIIPAATGNSPIVNAINSDVKKEVIKYLSIFDDDIKEVTSIEESIAAFNDEYINFKNNYPNLTQPWEAQIDGEIMFQSPEIISMSLTSYVNTGGVQGTLNISFLNYDTKTGNRIRNIDLFKNIHDIKALAKTYFEEAVENKSSTFIPNSFKLPENIGFNESGLILLFNGYETAPYASEIIEFIIPFEEVNTLLNFNSTR